MHKRIAVAALFSLSLLACSGGDRSSGGTGTTGDVGGTMVVAAVGNSDPLLPPLATEIITRQVIDQIYDRLADIGSSLNTVGDEGFQPRLAKSWQWSADSLSIAFALDPRARWHDGQPVRASDVRFTFNQIKNVKTGSQIAPLLANMDSVTARDSVTAVVWFHKRMPEQFYDFVYNVFIVPEHVLKDIPADKLATSDAGRSPVGSGPFRFVRWEPNVRIEIIADTANYRGRPKLDRVIWSLAPDPTAATQQLFGNQADLLENLTPELLARVDSTPHLKAVRFPGLGFSFMAFNARDRKRQSAPHPILGDVRVRRALSLALDRQSMLRNVFDTIGVLGSGPLPRALADTTVVLPVFDRARASALLDSAGWVRGPDSVRVRNGRRMELTLIVPNSSRARMRYAVLIQEQLRAIGAKVSIESMPFPEFIPKQQAHDFDLALESAGTDPSVGGSLKQSWTTDAMKPGGANYHNYSSRQFDALLDSSLASFDPKKSREYRHRALQLLADDAPAVWLYDVPSLSGVHKRLHPDGVLANAWFDAIPKFWIAAGDRIDRDKIGLRTSGAQP